MVAILQLLIISTISAAFARRVLSRWEPKFGSVAERLLFEYAAGLGLLGLLIFALGAVQLFALPAFIVLLLVMAAVSWAKLSDIIREIMDGLRGLRKHEWSAGSLAVTGIVGAIAVLALVRSLAPPVGEDWDSLAYHLAIPKLFLKHHGFYYIPFSSHSNFPFTWEMLYSLGLSFQSIALAKLFHFGAWLLLLWAVFSIGSRYFGRKPAGLALLIMAGVPVAAWEATSAYVDLAAALYSLLAVHALMNHSSTRDRGWVILAGLSAGMAGGVKMTGLVMIAVVVVWLLWSAKDEKPRNGPALAAIAGGLAVLIAAPWYIKTWIYTGSPVYPFFYGVFGGRNWSPLTAELYRTDQLTFGMGRDAASFLMLPWNLTFHFARFHDYAARLPSGISEMPMLLGSAQIFLVAIGPMFLAALPIVLLSALKRGPHRALLVISLALVVIWFFMTQQSRYLIPVFAILAPAMAWAAEQEKVRKVMLVLAGLTGLFTAYLLTTLAVPSAPVVFGLESPKDYLMRSNIYRVSEFVNSSLPADAKVALIGETRGFYLDRDYFWADAGHNAIIPDQDIGGRIRWLKSHGYDYVLVNGGTSGFGQKEIPPDLEEAYSDQSGGMRVYRIR